MSDSPAGTEQNPKPGLEHIVKNAGITLGGAALGGAMVFVNEIILARFLGVELYGLYALAFVMAKIGEILSLFGLRIAILHFLPIYRSEQRTGLVVGTVLAALILPVVIGCLLAILLWLAAPWLAREGFDEPAAVPYMRTLAFAIPFMSLSEILGYVTRGFGHSAYYVITRNLVPPVAFMVLLTSLRVIDADPIWVTGAFVVSYFLGFVVGAACVVKVTGQILWRVAPRFRFRKLYGYAFPIMLNTILYMVVGFTDILMLGAFMNPEQVGIYRACLQIIILFDMIGLAFNAATSHIYPVLAKQGKREELDHAYTTAIRWVTILAVPAFLIIALNAGDILSLLGPAFPVGAVALTILAAGQLVKSCLGSAGFLMVISGHQTVETVNALVAAVINVVLNFLLIPIYGIVGAATATAISMLVFNILRVVQVRILLGLPTIRLPMLQIALVVLLAAVALFAGTSLAGIGIGNGFGFLALRIGFCLALFSAVLWLFGLTDFDRSMVRRILGAVLSAKNSGVS